MNQHLKNAKLLLGTKESLTGWSARDGVAELINEQIRLFAEEVKFTALGNAPSAVRVRDFEHLNDVLNAVALLSEVVQFSEEDAVLLSKVVEDIAAEIVGEER